MSALAPAFFHQPPLLGRGSRALSAASLSIREQFESARREARSAASALQSQAYSALEEVFKQCSVDDWDGRGAQAISRLVYSRARNFLNDLPVWLPAPDIVPEPDGEIAVEWYVAPDWTFSISIGAHGPLHFAGIFGAGVERHGTEPFDDVVSPEIIDLINRILGANRGPSRRRAA